MLKKTRIAVFVSGGGTNLRALINAEKSGILKSGTLSLVLSNRAGVYALTRAAEAGIPSAVVEKRGAKQKDFEERILSVLENYRIDMIILAGFLSILSDDFVARYPHRIINVHPSLIPSFCGRGFYGLKVHEEALKRGVKVTGATVHYVNEIPDGGEIISQKAVEVLPGDTPETLQRRVMEQAEWILLPQAAERVSMKIAERKDAK